MIKGETKTGFKFDIDERALSDWRVVKLISKIQKNSDPIETIESIEELGKVVLKEKGFEKLLKHVEKNNDGYCCIDKVGDEIAEIFGSANELKN